MKKKHTQWFDSAIIKEDESKTTENSKHFVLNNGFRKAVFSPKNINYFDKAENAWKPIDNSLKSSKDKYAAQLGNYTASFSKPGENEAVEVTNGADSICWKYLGTSKNVFSANEALIKPNKRKSKLSVKSGLNAPLNLSKSSRVTYKNAEGDVDLEYLVEGNGIKENIVIKEKKASYRYYFLLHASGFKVNTSNDGRSIAFYKASDDDTTPEFIMPSPFMCDANGSRSDAVSYNLEKIDEESYVFSINAEDEWINASDRIFPVYIDPQLIVHSDPYVTVSHREYTKGENYNECDEIIEGWVYNWSPDYDYIYLRDSGLIKTEATLHIKKSKVDIGKNQVATATLVFDEYEDPSSTNYAYIKINGIVHEYTGGNLTLDITEIYNSFSDDFDIEMQMVTDFGSTKLTLPILQIEYEAYERSHAVRKPLDIESGVTGELDVISGDSTVIFDDISDSALGISVSHVYKPNDEIAEYGKNFRLNLHEKLEKSSTTSTGAQYVYTDPCGDKHTFSEHFYRIGTDGEKAYIPKEQLSSIVADSDGRLWIDGTEAYRELTSDRGLVASSRLEGVNNSEWVEQRLDEEKQVEEQVKSYENTLCNFTVVITDNDEVITTTIQESDLGNPDTIEAFLSGNNSASKLVLSKDEALAYKSLLTQRSSLTTSKTALELQLDSLTNNAKSLSLQYKATDSTSYQQSACDVQSISLDIEASALNTSQSRLLNNKSYDQLNDDEKKDYDLNARRAILVNSQRTLLNSNRNLINKQSSELAEQKDLIESQIRNFDGIDAPTGENDGILTLQHENTGLQIEIVDNQLTDIDAQLDLYSEKSEKYTEQFKSYYKDYLNLKNQLENIKAQVPVSYLISDSLVKGFNADGDLVIIQDKHDSYVAIGRERYSDSGATRISVLYDDKNRSATFSYNASGRLSEISNSLGEKTSFKYDSSGYLIAIERENQPSLTLTYTPVLNIKHISEIDSSEKTSAKLSYSLTGELTGITRSSTVNDISHGNVTDATSATTLHALAAAYEYGETKLTYDGIKQEIYKISEAYEQVTARFELINGYVTNAEYYTYTGHLVTKTEYADKSCLNRYAYRPFANFKAIGTVEDVTYDSFNKPVLVNSCKYAIPRTDADSPIEQSTTEYIYNDSRKLTEKKTTHTCSDTSAATVAIERFSYNNSGELIRKESFIEGEELITGVNIEEHVFNDKGVEIKSFTYNSLDPSSKFYTENEVDENGKVLCTLDESGEYKTIFDYERDGVTVKTERLPNGSSFSYGSAKDGSTYAITHSTEDGEENSTSQVKTLGVVTELKSGNNTVRYSYDNKRRVKSVSLNGVDNYVTYSYSGDNTDAEKVTATMADRTVATTTKNAYGNVTKSTCGYRTVTNTYNTDQQLKTTIDSVSGTTTLTYDDKGKVTSVTAPDHSESFVYDDKDLLTSKTVDGTTYTFTHKSTADKALDSISVDGNTVRPNTDALGRNTGKTIEVDDNKIAEEKISYVKFGDHATSLPSTVRFGNKTNGSFVLMDSLKYKYDSMGNIVEVFENGRSSCRYEYDALGRITREDNVAFGKTTTWGYDNNGNIIARYEYAITAKPTSELHLLSATCKLYAYDDNSDQLVSFNGEEFIYDTIGNPTTYRGKAATWAYGRQLATYDGNTFAYDARGRRIGKNGITFTYDSNGNLIKQSDGLEFLYDHTGVFAVKYNGSTYFYRKNAQQDIIALLDNNGTAVVKYIYDAWGNCKVLDANGVEITDSNNIGILNPFRYRSYYYDHGIGLYFLKTRYYDPEIGRFITIDDISYLDPDSINGLNLYAYCGDNPVMNIDPTGNWEMPNWLKWVIAGVTFIGAVTLTVFSGGALTPVFVGMGISIFSSAIIEGAISAYNGTGFWNGFINGAADGAMWGGIFALGGASIRLVKMFKNGVALGENMTRVTKLAKGGGQITYKGMPGYKVVRKIAGEKVARKLSMAHNEAFIKRMMKYGVKLVDYGIDVSRLDRSWYYLMETIVSSGYKNLIIV